MVPFDSFCNLENELNFFFLFCLQRPPSSSLSGYGHGLDDARSPGSGGGTPRLMPPGSHLSGDNISEAGKTILKFSNLI